MGKKAQATWGGRFSAAPSELMLRFSESVSFDRRLAPFDILVSKAHSAMLHQAGLLTRAEKQSIHKALDQLSAEVEAGTFPWQLRLEDVHMNLEHALTERAPAAAKLHTGRSRNDQVATDMRLFLKKASADLIELLRDLQRTTVGLARRHAAVLVPGFTHLQRAQPVSLAHHLLAYVEMFERDVERFAAVAEKANVCPLGSGAIAGTTLPIDRDFTARYLGFVDARGRPRLTQNSMDAVSDRDGHIEFVSACALAGVHLSRVAEDLIIWSSREFSLVVLPDAFCTGSSLMPQKKNPDSMELTRGKSARLIGNAQTLLTLVKGLPLTYNRDLQEDKPPLFDSLDQLSLLLPVVNGTLAGLEVSHEACRRAVSDPALLATDLVDFLVLEGVPFREAHHVVGELVKVAEQKGVGLDAVSPEDAQAVHPALTGSWREVFDLDRAMRKREGIGMPSPSQVRRQIARWEKRLA